jgi:catechol 2,3-dioxygenase-like lactoylglutathione lyase family enzyme
VARLTDLVVDCVHPASLARFWAAALDGYRVAGYDDAELARLRALGIDDPEDDPTVLVERLDGGRPRIWFQKVPEPKAGKNRLHVDLSTDDADAEVFRLQANGATLADDQPNPSLIVMHDPEGNEFCVLCPE